MHYYNGQAAAKRIGISYKTLLRWIEKGKIRPEEGKTPTGQLVISGDQVEAARKEVLKERSLFIEDEIAIDTSGQPQTEVDMPEDLVVKVKDLEDEVAELKARVEQLESKRQAPQPPAELKLPEDHVWLSGFADQHYVPRNEAQRLYDIHMIHGQPISRSAKSRKYIAIGEKGKRDFWVQMHTRPDFRACDDCPHEESRQNV
jgi:DNA-binding transcriptional MerR regulator